MSAFHLTFATRGRVPIAPAEGLRRALVRAILRVAGRVLALFCVVDDHVHVVLLCERREAGSLARSLLLAMRAVASAPIEPAHLRPVEARAHAEWLLKYLLTQTDHHGLDTHAALWSGSCLPELLGARAVEGWTVTVLELLPRFRVRDVHEAVGLPMEPLSPAPDETIRRVGAWRLARAVAFAAAVDDTLAGNEPEAIAARRACALLGTDAGIAPRDLADAMSMTPRQVARLTERAAPPAVVRAARVRLALEEVVREGRDVTSSRRSGSR